MQKSLPILVDDVSDEDLWTCSQICHESFLILVLDILKTLNYHFLQLLRLKTIFLLFLQLVVAGSILESIRINLDIENIINFI